MKRNLLFVTGAPGAGKSTTLDALLKIDSEYIAFDIDWLIESASALVEKDIHSDPGTWKPNGVLWFEILHSVCKNSVQPILFCPNSPSDIESFGLPYWCEKVHWILLDCEDEIRKQRLETRVDWNDKRKKEAFIDAASLREILRRSIDTSYSSPSEVAQKVLGWADSIDGSS